MRSLRPSFVRPRAPVAALVLSSFRRTVAAGAILNVDSGCGGCVAWDLERSQFEVLFELNLESSVGSMFVGILASIIDPRQG